MVARCAAITANNTPCSAQPVRADGYCYWHSPALAADRAEARRRGGKAKTNVARAKKQLPAEVMTAVEFQGLVCVVARGVVSGRLTPGVGAAIASLARAHRDLAELGRLEEQIAELEAIVKGGRAS